MQRQGHRVGSLVQAEEQPDGQGKKYKTRYARVERIKSVKILRTDTTHDLSQKAREDEEKEDGCKGKVGIYRVAEGRGRWFRQDRDPLARRWQHKRRRERLTACCA